VDAEWGALIGAVIGLAVALGVWLRADARLREAKAAALEAQRMSGAMIDAVEEAGADDVKAAIERKARAAGVEGALSAEVKRRTERLDKEGL